MCYLFAIVICSSLFYLKNREQYIILHALSLSLSLYLYIPESAQAAGGFAGGSPSGVEVEGQSPRGGERKPA